MLWFVLLLAIVLISLGVWFSYKNPVYPIEKELPAGYIGKNVDVSLAPEAEYLLEANTNGLTLKEDGSFKHASLKDILDDIESEGKHSGPIWRTSNGIVYDSRYIQAILPKKITKSKELVFSWKIPDTMYFTHHTHACTEKYYKSYMKSYSQYYNIEHYDAGERKNFMSHYFEDDIVQCYLSMDEENQQRMWALCILYVNGGIYMSQPQCSVPTDIQKYDLYFTGFAGILASCPGSLLIYEAITALADEEKHECDSKFISAVIAKAINKGDEHYGEVSIEV